MKLNSKSGIIALLVIGVLGLAGFTILNRNNIPTPDREEIPEENQEGLEDDRESINTIIYGTRTSSEARIYAVNDSGKNNTLITTTEPDIKFITPLVNGRQLFYISDTDAGDIGGSFTLKTIDSSAGEKEIYKPVDDYGIDRYVISPNNEWVAWYEVKPEGDVYTHASDYFRVYKANLENVLSGESDILDPILLSEIKGAPNVDLNVPSIISNNGEVLFDALIPHDYSLYYGFKNEEGQEILPLNSYNSNPYLFDDNNLLYTSFNPDNQRLNPKEGTNTRVEILNTNLVRTMNMATREVLTVGPGDNGEQYKHPVFVDGNPEGKFSFVTDVYQVIDSEGEQTLSPKEIQLVTKNADNTFTKDTILSTNDGKKYRILTVGDKPNGERTALIGEEASYRGNLGTGLGIGPSGYKNQITNIQVINLNSKDKIDIKSAASSEFEFISMVIKSPDEKIGIDRNRELSEEFAANQEQLQLDTFVPIEPKRERSNPRSDCEKEWQEKGYPNYEACEACPIYIYNDNVVSDIKIVPKTPLAIDSAVPQLEDNSWNFTADKTGNLSFSSGQFSKIDYLFPRGNVLMPEEGILITPANLEPKISAFSYSLGFNTRETKDIVSHFIDKLGDFNYAYISKLSEEEAKSLVDFEVYPKPKVMKNIMFYAKKYDSLSNVKGKVIREFPNNGFERSSYTVIAWGSVVE